MSVKAKKRNDYSFTKVRRIFKKTGGRCFYCGIILPADTEYLDTQGKVYMSSRNWHIDHVVAYSKGGGDADHNLVPSCKSCNLKKHDKSVDQFMNVAVTVRGELHD